MLGGVFISYRHEDSGYARLIYDRVTKRLERENVFFDVDNIQPGEDFVDILSERVGKCDALVAVIGKNWISADNRRRLDDPNDFVRIEIAAALARGIRVIPVLIDGATMPRPDDLPDSLKKLTRRHGIEISHTRFDSDVERLTRALALLDEELRQRERQEAAEPAEKAERERQSAEAEAAKAAPTARRQSAQFATPADKTRRAGKQSRGEDVGDSQPSGALDDRVLAERGDAAAQTRIGDVYREGKGVERDFTKAMEWYRRG